MRHKMLTQHTLFVLKKKGTLSEHFVAHVVPRSNITKLIKVADVLRIEIRFATWICPYHQNLWQKLRPKFEQTEVWDCPKTSLAASS